MLKRVNLYLESEALDFLSKLQTVSLSEHIRRAISAYIKQIDKSSASASAEKGGNNGK